MAVPSAERTVVMRGPPVWWLLLGRSGERPAEPGFPGLAGLVGLGVRAEQVVGRDHRLAESAHDPVQRIWGSQADRVGVGDVDDAVPGPDLAGEAYRVAGTGRLGQAEPAAEQRAVPGPARAGRAERGDRHGEPAGEVGEVLDQGAEVQLAAQRHRLELVRPVIAGQETAGDGAQHGAAARAPLDQELIGDEPAVRGPAAAVGEPVSRIPFADLQLGPVLAEHGADGACRHLVAAHEPGVEARPGRDGGPDVIRAGRDLGLVTLCELVTHQDSASRASASGPAVTLGWMATTR